MVVEFQVARLEVLFVVGCHTLGSYIAWYSGWSVPVSLALTAVLAWHGCYQLCRCLLLLGSSVTQIRFQAGGGARLSTGRGELSAMLVAVPYRSSVFTLLDFQPVSPARNRAAWRWAADNKIRVLVMAGGVPVSQRKRLAWLLNHGA